MRKVILIVLGAGALLLCILIAGSGSSDQLKFEYDSKSRVSQSAENSFR